MATTQSMLKSAMKKNRRIVAERLPSPDQTASLFFKDGQTNGQLVLSPHRNCIEISSDSSTQTKASHSTSSQQGRVVSSSKTAGETVKNISRKRKQEETEMSERDKQRESTVSTTNDDDEKIETAAQRRDKEEIKSIVSTRLWSDNANHVATAMACLYKLVAPGKSTGDKNRIMAFRLGAPLAIVQVMRWYINIPEIQRDGCFALAGLSLCKLPDAAAPQTILDTGGLDRCLRALQRHCDWATVQAAGCCLINNLCCSSPAVRKMVFIEGGLTTVLRAMDNHKDHGRVQNIGCRAINSLLLSQEPTCIKASVDLGGIEVVIAAMSNHAHDAELQWLGCKFLLTLLSTRDVVYFTRVVQAKGLVTIVEAQRIHKKNARVCRAAQNAVRAINSNFLLELSKI